MESPARVMSKKGRRPPRGRVQPFGRGRRGADPCRGGGRVTLRDIAETIGAGLKMGWNPSGPDLLTDLRNMDYGVAI
jgi:hypothetical protein